MNSRSNSRRAPLETRPSTLNGIEVLARRLQAANQITAAAARDQAAVQAGYRNFAHAQTMFAPVGASVHGEIA